jgi:hypothetical protein
MNGLLKASVTRIRAFALLGLSLGRGLIHEVSITIGQEGSHPSSLVALDGEARAIHLMVRRCLAPWHGLTSMISTFLTLGKSFEVYILIDSRSLSDNNRLFLFLLRSS